MKHSLGASFVWQSSSASRHQSDAYASKAGSLHLVLPARSSPLAPEHTSARVIPATHSLPSTGSSTPTSYSTRSSASGLLGRRNGASTPPFMSEMSAEEREAELVDAYDRIAQLELENQRLRQAMRDGNRLHC
jgi:hypothetical protein